jgi:hypothetical protein
MTLDDTECDEEGEEEEAEGIEEEEPDPVTSEAEELHHQQACL